MKKSTLCIICNSQAYQLYKYRDIFNKSVIMFKCLDCGHGFHKKKYSSSQFNNIYDLEYAKGYIGSKSKKLFNNRQTQYKLDVSNLLSLIKKKNLSVLDYGCSTGLYLSSMPNNWLKHGYEINKTEIPYIYKNNKKVKVYENLKDITKKFDLITMRGVIEHIQDHSNLTSFLDKRLKIGSYLYISATPDFSSPCASIYNKFWNQVICPQHIHQFSNTSLSIMMARANLVLYDIKHEYQNTPYANWNNDKKLFLKNINLKNERKKLSNTKHAFPGTMMSALFQKVR